MQTKASITFLLIPVCAAILYAQDPRGTILGRVDDPSGAIIPGASVEILNKAMGTRPVA
jgi:hypothetical protein